MNNLTMFEITETPDNKFAITYQGRLVDIRDNKEQAGRDAAYWELRNKGLTYTQAMEQLKRK